ncbi:MAG: pyruvate, phosphate dikinase [Burkholderiales bacterium]|nr:pyruvate, phosphate dikinase [Burkholderiales bacterium]
MTQHEQVFLIGVQAEQETAPSTPTPEAMGFKAYNLLRMDQMGLRVPAAFVLGTRWCEVESVSDEVWTAPLADLERQVGRTLGDPRQPLLLSVRSGAPVSMPGMMETLLNIGLCDATVQGFIRQTGNPRLVWDAYRRLVATHAEIVHNAPASAFDALLLELAPESEERELDFAQLRDLTRRSLQLHEQITGQAFPQDPIHQLRSAISAVFRSWQSDKAIRYRQSHRISDAIGTAVTVQTMVFGNAGGASGAGVGFTRNPITGEPDLWVDFLFNAQGEDVVSGRRSTHKQNDLAAVLPSVWQELVHAGQTLERHLHDMQDIEFTVEDGCLYMLQTRSGKRTPLAAARIALDMWQEGLIASSEALERTATLMPDDLCRCELVSDSGSPTRAISEGASASSGVVCGRIAFNGEQAQAFTQAGDTAILVRKDAETSDSASLEWAAGLLTERGARTSHAAVVARQMGKVCLTGCTACTVDEAQGLLVLGTAQLGRGDILTLDGNTGLIYLGALTTQSVVQEGLLTRLQALRQNLTEGLAIKEPAPQPQ